jgi:hypothetical protein
VLSILYKNLSALLESCSILYKVSSVYIRKSMCVMLVDLSLPIVNELVVVECSSVNPIYECVTRYIIAGIVLPIPFV